MRMSDFNCRQQTDLLCTAFVLGVFLSGLWRAEQFYTCTMCTIKPWKLPADTNRNQTEDVSIQTAAHRRVCLRAACLYAAPLPICHMTVLRGRSPSVWRSVLLLPPTSPRTCQRPREQRPHHWGPRRRHSRRTHGRNVLRRSCRLNDSPESIGAEVAGVSSPFGPRLGNPDSPFTQRWRDAASSVESVLVNAQVEPL